MNKAKDSVRETRPPKDRKAAAVERRARLADALKDNLRKRKAQARARHGWKPGDDRESSS